MTTTTVKLLSFGYRDKWHEKKVGEFAPHLTINVRSTLENPHSVAELRHLNGRDLQVKTFVKQDPKYPSVLEQALAAVRAGDGEMRLAIGCYGGKHRSVACVELIGEHLEKEGFLVEKRHLKL